MNTFLNMENAENEESNTNTNVNNPPPPLSTTLLCTQNVFFEHISYGSSFKKEFSSIL